MADVTDARAIAEIAGPSELADRRQDWTNCQIAGQECRPDIVDLCTGDNLALK